MVKVRKGTMQEPMSYDASELPDDVAWRLSRADGFLDLRMYSRARAELDAIPSDFSRHPLVSRTRLRLLIDQQAWAEARDLARAIRDGDPTTHDMWILLAYATRRCESVAAARQVLEEALHRFPGVPVIRFNLACYACLSGQVDEARRFLHQAFTLDKTFRETAQEDEDLRPLWSDLEKGLL